MIVRRAEPVPRQHDRAATNLQECNSTLCKFLQTDTVVPHRPSIEPRETPAMSDLVIRTAAAGIVRTIVRTVAVATD